MVVDVCYEDPRLRPENEHSTGVSALNEVELNFNVELEFKRTLSAVFGEAYDLVIRKRNDYGPNNIGLAPGGPLNGLRVRMHDKLVRINNLIDKEIEPNNESLRDSFLDMMNYAAIGLLVLDGNWPKE